MQAMRSDPSGPSPALHGLSDPSGPSPALHGLTARQRTICRAYCTNALRPQARTRIRASNPHCALLCSTPSGSALLAASGFILQSDDHFEVDVAASASALRETLRTLDLLDAQAPTLLSLPSELQLQCLAGLGSADLCAVEQTCSGASAASSGCLWLRLCDVRFWLEAQGAIDQLGRERWLALAPIGAASRVASLRAGRGGPLDRWSDASPVEFVQWKLVHRMEVLWERVRASCGVETRSTLRPGLRMSQLTPGEAATLRRLPADVSASLLVHDGQFGVCPTAVGLFFAGARMLTLREMAGEETGEEGGARGAEEGGTGGGGPLTDRVGFQQLTWRADGSVALLSGFNEHAKAASWSAFLERVLSNTV